MLTSLILFDNCGKTLASFKQGQSVKIGDSTFETHLQTGELLRLEKVTKSNNRDESYTRVINNMKNELSRRKQDLKILEKDIMTLMKKIQKDGDGTQELALEMGRNLQLKGEHKKKIHELLTQTKLSISYQQKRKVCSVVLTHGLFTKIPWFPKPIMWCKEVEAKLEEQTLEISEERAIEREEVTVGYLYAVGGNNASRKPVSLVESYDPDNDKWKAIADMHSKRKSHGVATLGGQLYVAGGYDGISQLSSVERYDPDENTWTKLAPMMSKRCGVGLAVTQNQLFALGGYDGTACLSTVERYDPEKNKWIEVAPMLNKRTCFGVTVYKGYVYAVGGKDGSSLFSSAERYNPSEDKWTPIASMHSTRADHGLSIVDGNLYAVGGGIKKASLSSVERYDSVQNKWVLVRAMNLKRKYVATAVLGGKLYAMGGSTNGPNLASVERYDPAKDIWTEVVPMSSARAAFDIGVIGI